MVYLEFHKEERQVVEIHEKAPSVSNDYDFALSDQFEVGDEFELTIWISEVDVEKRLISYSAIRNNLNAKRLLQENVELKSDNQQLRVDLNDAVMELSLLIAMGGMADV